MLAKNVNDNADSGFTRRSKILRKQARAYLVDMSYSKLQRLAPLPTVASESAGLCA